MGEAQKMNRNLRKIVKSCDIWDTKKKESFIENFLFVCPHTPLFLKGQGVPHFSVTLQTSSQAKIAPACLSCPPKTLYKTSRRK